MLLQTNSYVVPREKRAEHARLMRKFRQTLHKLGCDLFEVYEQAGANWTGGDTNGRYVQIMRFRDRKHQQAVQNAERNDPAAQALIHEFCEMVNFPYQQQQGLFAVGFYNSVLPVSPVRFDPPVRQTAAEEPVEDLSASDASEAEFQTPGPEQPEMHEHHAAPAANPPSAGADDNAAGIEDFGLEEELDSEGDGTAGDEAEAQDAPEASNGHPARRAAHHHPLARPEDEFEDAGQEMPE